MSRFVVKPIGKVKEISSDEAKVEPLADTDLFVADAPDPRSVIEQGDVAWAAPVEGDGGDSYPTGEVSVRFEPTVAPGDIESIVAKHSLELRSRNEFVPTQVTVAPSNPKGTWLPDVVEGLNSESVVSRAWPNTLSSYKRAE